MAYRKLVTESHSVSRDSQGRETSTVTKKAFKMKTTGEGFYFTFFDQLAGFFELSSATDIKLMAMLSTHAGFETGVLTLGTKLRNTICTKLGIHNSQISRSLRSLVNKKLITVDMDEVTINPVVFWKGSLETREKLLRDKGIEIRIQFMAEAD